MSPEERGLRFRPSLFWTFAGSFLVVLLAAALVQGWGVVSFLGTVERQQIEVRATAAVEDGAALLGAALESGEGAGAAGLGRRLHDLQPQDQGFWLVYVHTDGAQAGALDGGWHLPRDSRREVRRLLGLGMQEPLPPDRRPRADGPPRRRLGERPPNRVGDPRRGRRPGPAGSSGPPGLPPSEGAPAGDSFRVPLGGPDRAPGPLPASPEVEADLERGRVEVLVRRPVRSGGREVGVMAALLPKSWTRRGASSGAAGWLISLPLALVLAGVGGVLLLRHFLKRLRALEVLAQRVEEGDLEARVRVGRADEIGRLGLRLNRMTASLQQARGELEAADQQRRRLLADVSHELATPLTSIRGYAETLLDPEVPVSEEERQAYLRDVLSEARRMNLLIQDLFELARLEAGVGGLERETLDWAALCRHTLERFRPRFDDAGLGLRWQSGEGLAWVWADGRRLEQVLDNLLINALRYVPRRGTVSLTLEEVILEAGVPGYRLEVRDDGPGISPSELPHVFDRFFRAASVRSRSGSGLGLAIVREIVERHGGTVEARRSEPVGTVFSVTLPQAPPT